jgi:hypothetical protein
MDKNMNFKKSTPTPLPGIEEWQEEAFHISGDKAYFLSYVFYGAHETLCDNVDCHFFKE